MPGPSCERDGSIPRPVFVCAYACTRESILKSAPVKLQATIDPVKGVGGAKGKFYIVPGWTAIRSGTFPAPVGNGRAGSLVAALRFPGGV